MSSEAVEESGLAGRSPLNATFLKRRRLSSDNSGVGKALQHERDEGFTLVEMLIALMIFAIVMLALAPAFYGQLKAAAATSYRSTANGLAVAAIEQMRSFPYYEIGYNQSDYSTSGSTALSCVSPLNTYQTGGTAPSWNSVAGLKPVELSSGSALDDINNNLQSSQTISHITFTTTRCVYWVSSSTGDTAAYKETWIGVSWFADGQNWHVSHMSAIYPGGEGKYTTGQNNDNPGAAECQNQGTVPAAPVSLTAAADATYPASTVDLTWSAGTDTSGGVVLPLQYEVDYSSSVSGPWIPFSTAGLTYANVDGLASGNQYWFEVWAIACDGTRSSSAATVSQSTASSSQPCSATNFTVSPTSASIGSSDKLSGISAFQVSAEVTSGCSNVAVQYIPTITGSTVTDNAPGGTGTLAWTTSASKWAAGTVTFHLYIGGTDTGQVQQVTISCNAQHC